MPAWDDCSADERRLYARMMEVYAGFLTHTDAQVQRVLDMVEELGETDNTVVIVMSDNGASAEGGPTGTFNEQYFFNFVPQKLEENLERIDDLGTPAANNHYPWGWAWAGNTPLKRFKRDTHEGGVADPCVIHWPARFGTEGATCHQYTHAIDVLPTLLDLIGIEAPAVINGVEQTPIEGTSFAAALLDPAGGADAHLTQYYEMLGSRALYHDGWKAVVFHPSPMLAYDGTDVSKPFDDDIWELYNVREDFAEVHDLAGERPDKVKEMAELWWSEAERYQVLPLNNTPAFGGDPRHRRTRYEYFDGVGPIAEATAPNLKNRPWAIAAELQVPEGEVTGTIVAHGGHAGGYVLYVKDRRLHYTYNYVASKIVTISASVDLPAGPVVARLVFTPAGRPGRGGTAQLYYDDVPVGEGEITRSTPITYGTHGFSVGFQATGDIDHALPGRATMPDGVLKRVIVEISGKDPIRDAMMDASEEQAKGPTRADLATQ